jgi:uncharacterized protein
MECDRVGLGWRGELVAPIFRHLEAIDVLEVIAEDWFNAPRRQRDALRTLAGERPLLLHGVSLGLASSLPVDSRRLDRMARLCEAARPQAWSEHLAFVRAGGIEIGHLAAPPRTAATVEGSCANVERAARLVGSRPVLENIATLIDPPASNLSEPAWIRAIQHGSGAPLLLDLHNLYANALNFGQEPAQLLAQLPLHAVRMVHLSGGRWLHPPQGRPRLLDDHLHDVPEAVFDLLEQLAGSVPQPLDVIIERDGNYPHFETLLAQLQRARAALAAGRAYQLLRAAS